MNDPEIGRIKDRHIEICLREDVQCKASNGFGAYQLVADLPDFSFDAIDTSCDLFGESLSMPLLISPLTGGGQESLRINKNLAKAAQQLNIAMAVGSQVIMLKHPETLPSFHVRDVAPDILLLANLGLAHLNYGLDAQGCLKAVESINAQGLIFYVNPLQEVFQKAGMTNFEGLLVKLRTLCETFPYPIIVKEVGFGLSQNILVRLKNTGIAGIDVAGKGGTNWARVEQFLNQDLQIGAYEEFGTATAEALQYAIATTPQEMSVFASGGIRTGVEIAKALAMGAQCVGMGLPFLRWAHQSPDIVVEEVHRLSGELKTSMWYTGSKTIEELRGKIVSAPPT